MARRARAGSAAGLTIPRHVADMGYWNRHPAQSGRDALEGSIHRFNLAGVLQFLAQSASTGVLEVRDFEEYGFIYLVNGQVEAISCRSPTRSSVLDWSRPAA